MSDFQSDFMRTLDERGFIHQMSHEAALDQYAAQNMPIGYIGFDCTAPSLHIGNLVSILLLRKLQQAGGKPLVIMGGATSKIGDPSGKDSTRQMLTQENIAQNMTSIAKTFARFLRFDDSETSALIINNDDWLKDINYIEFLRDYGRYFSINRMLSFDSVRLRLEREQNLSFLEFNYMILQAYDFLALSRSHQCRLQMGGADQWGNIVNGIELARRIDSAEIFGLTTPLLTTASGAKMGKTAQGAVWLNEDMCSAYDYWQYWRNCEDADTARFLRLFTELPLDEIARLTRAEGAELNDAKKTLATQATAMAHGRDAAKQAAQTAHETFTMRQTSDGLPQKDLSAATLADGISLIEALQLAEFAASNSQARRLIEGNGIRVNDKPVSDIHAQIGKNDIQNDAVKLSRGKKQHVLLKLTS